MNPIPSVPTDNLYKFCSVAGSIAIVLSPFQACFKLWRDVSEKRFRSNFGQASNAPKS